MPLTGSLKAGRNPMAQLVGIHCEKRPGRDGKMQDQRGGEQELVGLLGQVESAPLRVSTLSLMLLLARPCWVQPQVEHLPLEPWVSWAVLPEPVLRLSVSY
jgi:hypothetical protein